MPFHLLVVGARISVDPGPAWLRQVANRGAPCGLRYDLGSYSGRRNLCFFTPTLIVQMRSREELPYKGRTIVTWPRRGCGGPHRHNRSFLCFHDSRSRSCSAGYKSYGRIGATRTDPVRREGIGRDTTGKRPDME